MVFGLWSTPGWTTCLANDFMPVIFLPVSDMAANDDGRMKRSENLTICPDYEIALHD